MGATPDPDIHERAVKSESPQWNTTPRTLVSIASVKAMVGNSDDSLETCYAILNNRGEWFVFDAGRNEGMSLP